MKFIRYLLFPISILYGLGVYIRHFLYDVGIKKTTKYKIPIICVGNISLGGTGKTPMTEYLIRLLIRWGIKTAVLSRGYRRKSKGFVLADAQSTVFSLGDEPFQYFNKFPNIKVAVDEKRKRGIDTILKKEPDLQAILLDDAFQHRAVQAGFSILLTTYNKLFVDDWILPMGDLRDIKSRAYLSNCILVTKCPSNLNENQKNQIINNLKPVDNQKVYFTGIKYSDNVISLKETITFHQWIQKPFTLVVGIANPAPLLEYLSKSGAIYEVISFADHHHFSKKEIEQLQNKQRILTTEKDYVRLSPYISSIYYLPIETYFLYEEEEKEFQQKIKEFLKI